MAIWLLRLNSVIFLVIGVWCALRARPVAENLGIAFTTSSGAIDFRATYAGMCLASGIFLGWASFRESWIEPSLWFAILLYAGLGLTRGAGMLIDGTPSSLMKAFFIIELAFIGLNALALRR